MLAVGNYGHEMASRGRTIPLLDLYRDAAVGHAG
jgi:hypothetical protein